MGGPARIAPGAAAGVGWGYSLGNMGGFMGEVWQRINRNSGALVVLLMVVSIIVGPSVFVWTEVQVNSAEIRQSRDYMNQFREEVREDFRELREDIRAMEDRLEVRMDRLEVRMDRIEAKIEGNQQQLLDTLAGHTHDADGTALFRTPPTSSP